MRHLPLLLLALALVQPALATTPVEAATLALRDVKTLSIDQQQHTAYFWAGAVEEPERFFKVFVFHINSLSREADLAVPVRVAPDVWRLDIRDYGWQKKVYDKLAKVDPYFHAKLQTVLVPATIAVGDTVRTVQECQGFRLENPNEVRGTIDAGTEFEVLQVQGDRILWNSRVGNVWVRASDVRKKQIDASAPWLPAKEMAELIALTQNEAPILRADWFFVQTARQIDRNNKQIVGYYDFLNIKKEADIEKLAGIDRKQIDARRREIRAIIADSGVTLHNRQIASVDDGSRGYWESLDVDSNDAAKNAVRQLDNDYKPVAKEVYFRLPNGLWGLAAVNAANGELAASVPDNIASDDKSTSNDKRIHPLLSCVRCHVEGLRPMDDWARKFYANFPGDAKLVAVEKEKLLRLRRLYLGPLQERYDDDQRYYTRVLKRLTGWEPKEAAKAYAAAWQVYADTPVTGKQLALELGVSHEEMIAAFKGYANVSADPVLIGFLKNPEFTSRREFIEEAYALFQEAIRQGGPKK